MLDFTIILGLIVATLMFCLGKWGWFDWYDTFRPKWLAWVRPCKFCLAFRLAMAFCIFVWVSSGNWMYLTVPLASAPVSLIAYSLITHDNG